MVKRIVKYGLKEEVLEKVKFWKRLKGCAVKILKTGNVRSLKR